MASLDSLPEELQFLILEFLDTTPPSHLRLRKEPCLTLTDNEDRTLKHISSISKRWRRLVSPMLFKFTRLRLDNPLQAEWNACTVCNGSAMATVNAHAAGSFLSGPIDRYHTAMVTAAKLSQRLTGVPLGGSDMDAHSEDDNASNTLPSTTFPWIARFYHALKDFIGFLQKNDLTDIVDSFVLYTDRMLEAKLHRFPHEAADKDWRFPASAAFWSHLLAVIEPSTITILAPPLDLACLTNCAVDTFGDWAFGEMDYHILTLRQTKTCNGAKALPSYSSLRSIPTTYPSIATSSILNLRPWTHLGLNEGPFLKAYGTYEFFERGPPSIVYSIKDSIIRRPRQQTQSTTASPTNDNTFIVQPLHNLSSLDYTAIFPFSNHADFSSILHQISHLSLQLAPDSSSNILNDRVRLGKADLADCWTELLTTYAQLVEPLATVRRPSTAQTVSGAEIFGGEFTWDTNWHDVAVRRLEALDFRIKAMQGELDELFTPLCLPVWVETPEGVFSRMGQEDEGANEES